MLMITTLLQSVGAGRSAWLPQALVLAGADPAGLLRGMRQHIADAPELLCARAAVLLLGSWLACSAATATAVPR